jgi:hypothetical protein
MISMGHPRLRAALLSPPAKRKQTRFHLVSPLLTPPPSYYLAVFYDVCIDTMRHHAPLMKFISIKMVPPLAFSCGV